MVYGMMGAYLMLFPRSRFYGAVNYDLKFWGAILCILLPVTYVGQLASIGLAETVIIVGVVGTYLALQPETSRIILPAWSVVICKYLVDVIFVREIIDDALINTQVRMLSGLAFGAFGAYCIAGTQGWKLTWETPVQSKGNTATGRIKMSVARLESEGKKSEEGARVYLGQRVFVGDVERAVTFYREVVIPKFPDLLLPLQEHIALARLLHFKGYDAEALKAYETMLQGVPELPDEYWLAWLKAAELTMKLAPDDTAKARRYLDQFELGTTNMMRDRVEAQRLRATLPVVEEPKKPVKALPVIETVGAATSPASAESQARSKSDNNASDMDAVRIRPRTFVYVPGAAPVSIAERQVNLPQPELDDKEFLNKHWKPLPSLGDKNPTMASLLERRIKNPRAADTDEDAPSMYQALTGNDARRSLRKSRVAQLEVVSTTPSIAPVVKETIGSYGSIAEIQGPLITERYKLRGEKETPKDRNRPARQKPDWDKQFWRTLAVDMPEGETEQPEYSDDIAKFEDSETGIPVEKFSIWSIGNLEAETVNFMLLEHAEIIKTYSVFDVSPSAGSGNHEIFLQRVPKEKADMLIAAAKACNWELHIANEDSPVFRMEPLELLEITMDNSGLQLKTLYGNRRLAWDEPVLVALSHMKLTPDSKSMPRWMLEIICLGDKPTRFQLFERTVSVRKCHVDGHHFDNAVALIHAAALFTWNHVTNAIRLPGTLTDLDSPELLFESYRTYDLRVLHGLITKAEL